MSRPPLRICVPTSSRADWSHLVHPMRAMAASPDIEPRLVVLAAHLSPEFGSTVKDLQREGFPVDATYECLLSSDSDVGMAKTIGVAVQSLADDLGRTRPDALFVVADPYEMLAPAAVALALRIPILHLEGGDVSEGAIDDAVRNALTKMAHVHLTPTHTARRRVLAMGEEPWRVHRVGAPSLDHLRSGSLPDAKTLARRLGHALDPAPIVVAFHPRTLAADTTDEGAHFLKALEERPEPLIFLFPNADAGSRQLLADARATLERRAASGAARADAVHANLPPSDYFGLLRSAAALVGNSSSGIMESASLRLPTLDVGDRQAGRERARNVLHAPADCGALRIALQRVLDPAFRASLVDLENPYGDGHASERIVEILRSLPGREELLRKRAAPLPATMASAPPEAGASPSGEGL